MNGAGGAVPSPTIGAVAAAVSGSGAPSGGEGNGARRVGGDPHASVVGAVVGVVGAMMGAMMFGLVW